MLNAPTLDDVTPEILQRIATAPTIFCFLDYDGTLAAIAPTPAAAVAWPGTVELLRQLAAAPGTRLAVVSGRTLADLRRFVDLPGLYYIGVHGAETQLPNGTRRMAKEALAIQQVLPQIEAQLRQALAKLPGILFERKDGALACHYRLASSADAAIATQMVETITATYQRRSVPIVVAYGHEVIELRPAGINKGKAVCALLEAEPADVVIYIGDDRTDEDAFKALPPQAITIRVGPPTTPTRARHRLADPAAVQHFLRAVLKSRADQPWAPLSSRTTSE